RYQRLWTYRSKDENEDSQPEENTLQPYCSCSTVRCTAERRSSPSRIARTVSLLPRQDGKLHDCRVLHGGSTFPFTVRERQRDSRFQPGHPNGRSVFALED